MESIRSCGKSICKTVWFGWYSIRAGIINFVVLTAAASSCNSGIFANSRTLFGLVGRKQGPPFLHKTNKHGVPYYAILLTCGLLSIAIILNAVFKDATSIRSNHNVLNSTQHYDLDMYYDCVSRFREEKP